MNIMWILLSIVLVILALAYVSTMLGHFFYGYPTTPDRVEFTEAEDGWRLGFERHYAKGERKGVVVTCHGLAVNHYNFDLGERTSLVKELVEQGWEVWNASLRGCGHSRKAPDLRWSTQWNFDDHVRLDVPATLEFVTRKAKVDSVHWVGHSMGGLVMFGHLGSHPDESRVASVCTLGSGQGLRGNLRVRIPAGSVTQLSKVIRIVPGRAIVQSVAPMFVHWPVNMLLCTPKNMTLHMFRRAFFMLTENLSSSICQQIYRMMKTGEFKSMDGAVDYRSNLSRIRTPLCLMAGSDDYVVPPSVVKPIMDKVQSEIREFHVLGLESGCRQEYCHGGLLMGRHSQEDVFPKIADWLERARTSKSERLSPSTKN